MTTFSRQCWCKSVSMRSCRARSDRRFAIRSPANSRAAISTRAYLRQRRSWIARSRRLRRSTDSGERYRGCRLPGEETHTQRNSVWALSSRSAWESSEYCCSCESWAGSSAGPGEGIPRRWAWAVCLSPEWGRALDTDQDLVADMEPPAAVSSRACSEDLAELSLATGFTTSSPVTTVAPDTAMPPRIHPPNLPHPPTRAATNSLAVMTMAAREPLGTIQVAPTLVVVTGAAAMAAVTGAGVVVTGAGGMAAVTGGGGVVTGAGVETAEVGDPISPNFLR